METVPFYPQIQIVLKTSGEDVIIPPQRSYENLIKYIYREYVVTERLRLSYFNDFGVLVEITDENSYLEALLSTNGQFHYIQANIPLARIPSRLWKCALCHFDKNDIYINPLICRVCRNERRK